MGKRCSNYYGQNERVYESWEHCFQGKKYIRLGELCEDKNRKVVSIEYGKIFMKPLQYITKTKKKIN